MHNTRVAGGPLRPGRNASPSMTLIFNCAAQRIDIITLKILDAKMVHSPLWARLRGGVGRVTVTPRRPRPPEGGGREPLSLSGIKTGQTGRNFSASERKSGRARPLFHGNPDGTELLCPTDRASKWDRGDDDWRENTASDGWHCTPRQLQWDCESVHSPNLPAAEVVDFKSATRSNLATSLSLSVCTCLKVSCKNGAICGGALVAGSGGGGSPCTLFSFKSLRGAATPQPICGVR